MHAIKSLALLILFLVAVMASSLAFGDPLPGANRCVEHPSIQCESYCSRIVHFCTFSAIPKFCVEAVPSSGCLQGTYHCSCDLDNIF